MISTTLVSIGFILTLWWAFGPNGTFSNFIFGYNPDKEPAKIEARQNTLVLLGLGFSLVGLLLH
ncbi:hypothetical protein [Ferrimonas marina]|uniref:Uncharacterized protein n=1 Tax=Ferrimonas marina TaxID=299255 RepID=A0A1M5ZFX4_9GAMM|nr:hypothetical protein [Ferrimonas marina]SHI23137.1 hypothetical protein SAMN02745129_0256 [Ferrimonas marina]